jgi:hypothetical protein
MTCSVCGGGMEQGFMYVRGIGGAVFWGGTRDVGFLSRKGLEQIDLGAVSVTGTGAQAVVDAWRCNPCKMLAFRSSR